MNRDDATERPASPVRPQGLTISIVTFNTWTRTNSCIESIIAHQPDCQFEILVHDNGQGLSTHNLDHRVSVFHDGANIGFGQGHNANLHRAHFDTFLILNPDTTILPGALSGLQATYATHKGVAAVAPQLRNPDGTLQQSYRRLPSALTEIGRLIGIDQKPNSPFSTLITIPTDSEAYVPQPPGAALLSSTALLEQVRGFDSRFKMYFEDVDLCARLAQHGQILVDHRHTIIHDGEGTARAYRQQTTFWIERSRFIYHLKHRHNWPMTTVTLFACLTSASERAAFYAFRSLRGREHSDIARAKGYGRAVLANLHIRANESESRMLSKG